MTRIVHSTLCKVFAVVLVIIGIGATIGGNFDHGYVTDQLSQEKITMPSGKALTSPEMKDALDKYAGQQMTTGPQAEAFANHFIYEHMKAASNGRTYQEVSGDYMKCSADEATKNTDECKKLESIRATLFQGDSLRGMLLNAYGWWLIGTIAIWAGVACIVLGVVLAILGWGVLRTKKDVVQA
ncbi:hypothetical protein O6R08_05570 [Cutibacterium equinum]|uniref:Uncharacterized protein n=1 Tax=Cutibacterium equinum TaxID=3016342 RepID=A0ABY7R0T8_9ACTN|nr:hypothetical protein [Cutibacterium equinum]WCC80916.1 hypothetical protein O6R08_05570 [Cutibacterium equinum]